MRILEIETFGRGGLIHYAYNLSCALAERGHRVTLVTTAAYELEGEEFPLPDGVRLVKAIGRFTGGGKDVRRSFWPAWLRSLRKKSLLRKLEAIFDAAAVTLLTARLRPDVVHLHCTNPAALVYLQLLRLLPSALRGPVVATAHVVTPHEPMRLQQAVYRRIHQLPHRLIAHSQHDRQRLVDEFGVAPKKVTVIPHGEYGFFEQAGVETGEAVGEVEDRAQARATARRDLELPEEAEVALFFGYIREYKGLDVLLEAWPAVQRQRPEARLLIAGDPVQLPTQRREELEAWAQRLGAVHHFGYVPFSEVQRYFTVADVLVMPYRHISQSGVLYLALALGLPVLATRVGAVPEVLTDGESGALVPPESPDELARTLSRLLGDPALQQRLAEGGRQVAREHSWPSIAKRTVEVFAESLDSLGS
ncbi:MAG: glycosyltransferase family 4 protein [Acidobacteriota bacterium]|nr:glycosyltransferase family 4 protein [Acidobacteriota bacterium]